MRSDFGENTDRARSDFSAYTYSKTKYTKRKIEKKSERKTESERVRARGRVLYQSAKVETETYEGLFVLSENYDRTTILSTLHQVSSFHVFLCFCFLLFFYPPSWVRIVAKVVALR